VGYKLKFVLSDLHLGAGHIESNYLEDFTVDTKLAQFLQAISHESERDQREVELIINGDFFEFLEVPAVDNYRPGEVYPDEAYLDSSEQASIQRLNIIVEGHPLVFDALSDFIHVEAPQRRITLIKGNHDVNLYWPGVKARLREILGTSGTRSSMLLFAEEFISRERIYVEHGHQRAETINCYNDFLDPRLPGNPTQLYHPVGSRLVIDFFNNLGREYWFVDNIKPLTTLIWYALRWDFEFAAQMLASFIRHSPTHAELSFIFDDWLQGLEDAVIRRNWSARYQADPAFRQQFHRQALEYLSPITELAEISDDSLNLGRAAQRLQQTVLYQAAAEIAQRQGAALVIFGHSHRPAQEVLATGGVYLNTGGWLRDLSAATPETWQTLFTGRLSYRDIPLNLPYARIDYDEDNQPMAQLLDFNTTPSKLEPVSQAVEPEQTNPPAGNRLRYLARFFGGRAKASTSG
jgi:UDP-2,3-diacylglucosamine pyrophosphatase LpxH